MAIDTGQPGFASIASEAGKIMVNIGTKRMSMLGSMMKATSDAPVDVVRGAMANLMNASNDPFFDKKLQSQASGITGLANTATLLGNLRAVSLGTAGGVGGLTQKEYTLAELIKAKELTAARMDIASTRYNQLDPASIEGERMKILRDKEINLHDLINVEIKKYL